MQFFTVFCTGCLLCNGLYILMSMLLRFLVIVLAIAAAVVFIIIFFVVIFTAVAFVILIGTIVFIGTGVLFTGRSAVTGIVLN